MAVPETMHRFFAMHVGILPAALVGFAATHLILVRARGASTPSSERDLPWFPDFFRRELVLWVVALHAMAAAGGALSPRRCCRVEMSSSPPPNQAAPRGSSCPPFSS